MVRFLPFKPYKATPKRDSHGDYIGRVYEAMTLIFKPTQIGLARLLGVLS